MINDPPIFAGLISEIEQRRLTAETQAEQLARLVADIEALHEPDIGGECPTCGVLAPCPTFQLVHREIDLATAYAVIRGELADPGQQDSEVRSPAVPHLAELLNAPTDAVDHFFDILLR